MKIGIVLPVILCVSAFFCHVDISKAKHLATPENIAGEPETYALTVVVTVTFALIYSYVQIVVLSTAQRP